MAGSNQHHIPDFLLRAFRIPGGSKKKSRVWIFERNKTARLELTKQVAAEPHFYSELSADGSPTLDEMITDYEGPFARQYQLLRDGPVGNHVDSAIAAEVVAHLTIRGAHLRTTMGAFLRAILSQGREIFCDESKLRPLLGIDAKIPSSRFEEALDEELLKYSQVTEAGIPREVINKMAFMITKEKFNRFFLENGPLIGLALEAVAEKAHDTASDAHNKALSSGLAPDVRTKKLSEFNWSAVAAPLGGVILPDCVALGFEEDHRAQPLMLADLDKVDTVLMPLASDKVLVGSRGGALCADFGEFNNAAAFCSQTFFVSARTGDDLQNLVSSIGKHPSQFVNDVTTSTFSEFLQVNKSASSKDAVARDEGTAEPNDRVTTNDQSVNEKQRELRYSVNFLGCADQETAEKIAAVVNNFISEIHGVMPIDRLDGITFASDYPGALRDLDRGFAVSSPLKPITEDYGVGVSMAPLVLREGLIKGHIVIQGGIGHALLSEVESDRQQAIYIIAHQLALVAAIQSVDETLPGNLLNHLENNFDTLLYSWIHPAWLGYFAARTSAISEVTIGESYQNLLTSSLDRMHEAVPSARLAYRFDGDLDKFLNVAMPAVGAVLQFAGKALGHFDGLKESLVEIGPVRVALQKTGLLDWIAMFDSELSELWNRRNGWESFSEFTELNRHAERLLWQYGVIPWKTDQNEIHVTVPIGTDAALLASLQPSPPRLPPIVT